MIIRDGFVRKVGGEWFNLDYCWFFEVTQTEDDKYVIFCYYVRNGHTACFQADGMWHSRESAQNHLDGSFGYAAA